MLKELKDINWFPMQKSCDDHIDTCSEHLRYLMREFNKGWILACIQSKKDEADNDTKS